MKKKSILIIDNDINTLNFLESMLSKEFETITANLGSTGLEEARNRTPNLVILSYELPTINGLDLLKLLKNDPQTSKIPIILISEKYPLKNIEAGLQSGAIDYISKPFYYRELFARIKAHLDNNLDGPFTPIVVGELIINERSREVTLEGNRAKLTLTEFDLLKCLASHAGKIISREEILKSVWQDESEKTNDRTIDVHIRALRRKLPSIKKNIVSIYGVGYKYEF
jgi:DNA-binding response OmpR family regulator